ncbi:unnamed protein product [Gongylonema pulchrum]|uniref:HAP1 N-terminal domain-containing protein n=1 Tax=Gongylonema pulchrum TaxID=637853 RepID=A0A183E636_9BILA|nr:unnamed protein product [Gongylonema pulchrum]
MGSPVSSGNRDRLWSPIEELQGVNQKLIAELHTINAKQNLGSKIASTEELGCLTEMLDGMMKELSLLKDQNSQLLKERDMYKQAIQEKKR